MARKVFYSFYYDDDAARVQQVKQMGRIESQPLLTGNKWEEIKKGGDPAIERWIKDQMTGKTCLVVLVGARTASRPWVQYEIKEAWKNGLGVVGIRIHSLKDLQEQIAVRGANPFDQLNLNGKPFAQIVTLYDPAGSNSKEVYADISNNLENLVERAIQIRARY
ncbi:MAG: TIR domain-containing protein [Geminicoccaceae bacterium]